MDIYRISSPEARMKLFWRMWYKVFPPRFDTLTLPAAIDLAASLAVREYLRSEESVENYRHYKETLEKSKTTPIIHYPVNRLYKPKNGDNHG